MAYDLAEGLKLGPKNTARFEELVARMKQAQTKVDELDALLERRRQEQRQHSAVMATVNLATDPTQLSTAYGLRSAQSEILGKIEEELAQAKQRRNEALDNLTRQAGQLNNLYSGYSGWLLRVAHAQGEADGLKAQWEQ